MRTPARRSPPQRGFTLIELLVAVGIMALMAVLGWRALAGMQQASSSNRDHADAVLTLDAGLGQWGADLDALVELPQTRTLEWDGRALRLTRRPASDAAEGASVVAWTRADRDGSPQWLRWQSAPVRTREEWQSAWLAASAWAQGADLRIRQNEVRIAPLTQWQLYFYRGGAWSNPLSSAGSSGQAPAGSESAGTNVPDGIRLQLTLPAGHPLAGTVVRDWARIHNKEGAQ